MFCLLLRYSLFRIPLLLTFLVHLFFNQQTSSTSPSTSRGLSESDILASVEAAGNKITKNYDDGNVYVCQMEGGQLNGYGTYTWAGGQKYVGENKNGKKDGNGTYTFANGAKYVGEWKNGEQDGNGTYTYANGTILHSGEWVNNKPKK